MGDEEILERSRMVVSHRLAMTIRRSADKQKAELIVDDQGKGLPPEERERVMRPFERGESARSGVT